MIYDLTERFDAYVKHNDLFSLAADFLKREDLHELENGRHDIQGDDVFAIVMRANGRTKDEAQLEVHNEYIDIQAVLGGVDEIAWKPRAKCELVDGEYDADSDLLFFNDKDAQWLPVTAGESVVFFPEDAHAPMVGEGEIHKVVIKVRA